MKPRARDTKIGFCYYDHARARRGRLAEPRRTRTTACGDADDRPRSEWALLGLDQTSTASTLPARAIDVTDVPDGTYSALAGVDASAGSRRSDATTTSPGSTSSSVDEHGARDCATSGGPAIQLRASARRRTSVASIDRSRQPPSDPSAARGEPCTGSRLKGEECGRYCFAAWSSRVRDSGRRACGGLAPSRARQNADQRHDGRRLAAVRRQRGGPGTTSYNNQTGGGLRRGTITVDFNG